MGEWKREEGKGLAREEEEKGGRGVRTASSLENLKLEEFEVWS